MQYKAFIHYNSHYKQLYLSNKESTSVIKVGVAYVNICISRHLTEDLDWAMDKNFGLVAKKCLKQLYIPLRI